MSNNTSKPVVAGVIGCGSIARFHFEGLAKAGARIKWICDLKREAAAPWLEKTGARYTADFMDIVRDPEVSLVDVLTISSTHRAICMAAIEAGKGVVCEKTLAENPADARAIVRAAEAKGVIFYTSYMKRFIPALEQAKALLPELGQIFSSYIRAFQCWGDLWSAMPGEGMAHTPPGGMSGVRRSYGGGILVCGGSHILDLVVFLLGRPARVYGSVYTPPGRDYDIQAAAMLDTPNGVVHYEATAHPLNRIGFLRDGWDERIEINGLKGRLDIYSAAWNEVDHKASLLVHYDNASGVTREYRYPPVSPFTRAIAFYCANIAAGRQGAQSRATGYEVDALIDAIVRSSASGRPVAMEWD